MVAECPSRRWRSAQGFTALEVLLAVSIGAVVAGMSVISIRQSVPQLKADAARRTVQHQLRWAREIALTQRRTVEISFPGNNEIQLRRVELDGRLTDIVHTQLEGQVQFTLFNDVPDTPDAFGRTAPVSFGAANRLLFLSDGTFVDQTGRPLNGTVFMAIPNQVTTSRAITVFGPTGRIAGYRWSGTEWQR
jgi:prepilin-type N-terminal cleavage/methylation domain-containing protein